MKPANMLFILSDNHARAGLGAASGGVVRTPHLDALAARGTRFTAAYTASPICCPARAAIATGRYPHETGYWDNAITYDGRVPTWHHRLRDAGHRCAAIGKLHFRSHDDDNGFTEEIDTMHILGGKGGVSMLLRACGEEPINVGQWELYAERSGEGSTTYQAYDVDITRQAVAWLEKHARTTTRPWMLMVSYVSAHPPFSVPKRLLDLYRHTPVAMPPQFSPAERSQHPASVHHRHIFATRELDAGMLDRVSRAYYALCTHLDEQIGQLLTALVDLGLIDDTRVIYTSDHGDMLGEHGLLGKFHLYEGSAGVPLIMAGPGIPGGQVIDEPVSHIDLYPTILDAFGVSQAERPPSACSLWPVLAGRPRPAPVFAEYHAAGSRAGSFMLRTRREKLICDIGAPPQVFDMAADPHETVDLASTAEGMDRLSVLERQLRAVCDPEEVDRRAKADQRAKIAFWGGEEAIRQEGLLVFTPAPGTTAEIEKAP